MVQAVKAESQERLRAETGLSHRKSAPPRRRPRPHRPGTGKCRSSWGTSSVPCTTLAASGLQVVSKARLRPSPRLCCNHNEQPHDVADMRASAFQHFVNQQDTKILCTNFVSGFVEAYLQEGTHPDVVADCPGHTLYVLYGLAQGFALQTNKRMDNLLHVRGI